MKRTRLLAVSKKEEKLFLYMSNFEIRWASLTNYIVELFMIGLTHEGEIANFLEEFFGQYTGNIVG